jgi:hypothetical protein
LISSSVACSPPPKHGPALGLWGSFEAGTVPGHDRVTLRNKPASATLFLQPRIGGGAMTTVAYLLARKQQLLERLQENPGPNERAEIERLLAQVDAALNLLEEVGPGKANDEP